LKDLIFLILVYIYRKAVKAAIFLLPLLGITHMLETFVSPGEKEMMNNKNNSFFLFKIIDQFLYLLSIVR